jgi:hypothetical protein
MLPGLEGGDHPLVCPRTGPAPGGHGRVCRPCLLLLRHARRARDEPW